jgi:hypothetical protein
MNPFLAFCLYVASRVFVQYLKSRRDDSAVKSSLHFLLAAMQVLKTKNPLTESFLVQLDVDLEGSGLDIPSHSRYKFGKRPPVSAYQFNQSVFSPDNDNQGEVPANTDSVSCSPLFEIRSTQGVPGTGVMPSSAREGRPPAWSNDTTPSMNSMHSEQYPSLFTQAHVPVNDCAKIQKMDHLEPVTNFSGDDLLYGGPQIVSVGPTPEYVNGEPASNSSNSTHPTPASSSNTHSSRTNLSPPQQNQSAFSPSSNGDGHGPLFGTSASPWNFVATHQNKSPHAQSVNATLDDHRGQGHSQEPFPSGTGMTPGATGMTPLPESLWQSVNDGVAGEWMYGWSGSGTTPGPS